MSRWRRAWPHVRAGLVAVHLAAIGLAAVPAPQGGMSRSAWKDPTVQGEIHAWAGRARALGLHADDASFQRNLWNLAKRYMRVRGRVLAPFGPYYLVCGTDQAWRMFVAPHRYPARLHVDLREPDGTWKPVYVSRDPDLDWMASAFDHDRVRAATFRYAWPSYRRGYHQLALWLARRAAADFPEATEARFRWYKYRTPSPDEVVGGREPPGRYIEPIVVDLAPLRPDAIAATPTRRARGLR